MSSYPFATDYVELDDDDGLDAFSSPAGAGRT